MRHHTGLGLALIVGIAAAATFTISGWFKGFKETDIAHVAEAVVGGGRVVAVCSDAPSRSRGIRLGCWL